MNAKAVSLMLSGLLSVAAAWPAIALGATIAREEGDFQRLVERFYANPQPRSLPAALKYFVDRFSRPHPLGTDDRQVQIAAYARFFAALGDRHPEVWRHAEQLFDQGNWSERRVLLELFSRNQDESLKTSLRRWAAEEDDPDRRILLERCLFFSTPVLEILNHPPENQSQLEEQWAVFFALGDVRVVHNTLALLVKPVAENASAQRLRESSVRVLLQRARVHPPVRAAIAEALALQSESKALLSLRQALACQALQTGEFKDFDRWLPSAWISQLAPDARLFFEACADVLQSRSQAAPGKITSLASSNRVQAEWLRAHHAYLHLRGAEALAGRGQPLSDQGRELLLKARDHLLQDQALAVYSLWALETEPPQPRAEEFFHLQLAIRAGQDRRWLTQIQLMPTESQAQNGDRMLRWTDRNPQWIPVDSGFLGARIRQEVRTDELAVWLEQTPPRSISKLFPAGSAPLIRVAYGPTDGTALWNETLERFFPGQRHELANLTLDLDASTQQLVRLQADVRVEVEGQPQAQGRVTQIFYEPGTDSLSWLEGLR
jgi:hypothetical protein